MKQASNLPETDRFRHGMKGTPTYRSWRSMRARCHYPCVNGYANYGGRGITVCDRWKYSFRNFLEDMGKRPPGMELGRIDNDGPYSKANCEWQTRTENGRNRRSNLIVTCNGKKMAAIEAEELCGHNYNTLIAHLYNHPDFNGDVASLHFPPLRKLNQQAVKEIRASTETHGKIAIAFGVSRTLIGAIQRRQIWKHI